MAPHRRTIVAGETTPQAAVAQTGPQVGRRHAVRTVLAGAIAAIGAAVLGDRNPRIAEGAATTGSIWYTSTSPAATGSTATIEGDNTTLGGDGVMGVTNGGNGVYGNNTNVNGGTGVLANSAGGAGVYSTGQSFGVQAIGNFCGVSGTSAGGVGVSGSSTAGGSYGVYGNFNGSGVGYGVYGNNQTNEGYGVYGNGDCGVYGKSTAAANGSGFGVYGTAGGTGNTGVYGAGDTGVYGTGGTRAIWGQLTGSGTAAVEGDSGGPFPGVVGVSDGLTPPVGIPTAVLGLGTHTGMLGITSSSTAAGVEGDGFAIGVQGISQTTGNTTGYGVVGRANNGTGSAGILGTSTSGYGFYGYSTATGNTGYVPAGVLGYNSQTSGAGLIAYNGGAGSGYAAIFGSTTIPHSGNVLVEGTLTTMNGAPSVAARDASGSLHRLYGVQSPESWFEDFGSGQLSGGSATVALDPAFAGLVDASDYHVFLTPEGESQGWLFVSSKSATGFTVREAGASSVEAGGRPGAGGGSSINFSYRVVARRKDVASVRLKPVAEPPATAPPTLPNLPPAASSTGLRSPEAPES